MRAPWYGVVNVKSKSESEREISPLLDTTEAEAPSLRFALGLIVLALVTQEEEALSHSGDVTCGI